MTGLVYTMAGALLVAMGVWGVVALAHPLRKLLAINVSGSGVFLVLVAAAAREPGQAPDPVAHALVLTGLVVSVSATALGLVLMLRSHRPTGKDHTSPGAPPSSRGDG